MGFVGAHADAQSRLPISCGDDPNDRTEGLLWGAMVGDALGGPYEFQGRSPLLAAHDLPRNDGAWRDMVRAAVDMEAYDRPAEPYGHWDLAPGSITDDSRFKLLYLAARKGALGAHQVAARLDSLLLAVAGDEEQAWSALQSAWLYEFLGPVRHDRGLKDPPSWPQGRMWGGMATMAGQMPYLVEACYWPGEPAQAYRFAYEANRFDNGMGLDMTSMIVAGLAHALTDTATFAGAVDVMLRTDPYGYGAVPWVPREAPAWLTRGQDIGRRASSLSALYADLERELDATTWWEARVPLTVVTAAMTYADEDPVLTMGIILGFGHDTDSYLQLAGAFLGALGGVDVFPPAWIAAVAEGHRRFTNAWLEQVYQHSRADEAD